MARRKGRHVMLLCTLIAIPVLFMSTGCRSVTSIIKANFSGMPFWYYEPDSGVGKGNTGIVAEGVGPSERQSELLAYTELIGILSDRIGYDLGSEAYRELSVMGTLSDFSLFIADHHVTSGSDGNYHYYIHAVMDKEKLDMATSDESKRRTALSMQIESLVAEGDSFVKTGYELKAVQNYMRAMAAGYESDFISSEYSYDELYPVVYELLQSMKITITNERPDDAVCTVSVSRKGMFASSAVAGAEVKASYLAVDTRGIEYDDSFVYISDVNGSFTFNSINNSILRNGSIEFSLNLSEELAALEKVAPGERTQALRELVESKNVRFDYAKTFRSGRLAVAVIEHDSLGYVTGVHEISDYLTGKFISDGALATAFYAELDDEEDVIYEFNHSGRTEPVMIVIRTGVVDVVRSRMDLTVANVEGLVTVFRCSDEQILYQSDVLNASSFAETEEEAVSGAFRALVDIAYTLVKAVYV